MSNKLLTRIFNRYIIGVGLNNRRVEMIATKRTADEARELAKYIGVLLDNEPDTENCRFVWEHKSEGDQSAIVAVITIPYDERTEA